MACEPLALPNEAGLSEPDPGIEEGAGLLIVRGVSMAFIEPGAVCAVGAVWGVGNIWRSGKPAGGDDDVAGDGAAVPGVVDAAPL
jgi:hypothetical protein